MEERKGPSTRVGLSLNLVELESDITLSEGRLKVQRRDHKINGMIGNRER